MPSENKSVTEFLNVDLDIRVQDGLEILLDAIAPSMVVLDQTSEAASLELTETYLSIDETTARLIEVVNSLPPEARTILRRCELRSLNIGIQAGTEPHSFEFPISKETVSAIADAGFDVVITVYASRH